MRVRALPAVVHDGGQVIRELESFSPLFKEVFLMSLKIKTEAGVARRPRKALFNEMQRKFQA